MQLESPSKTIAQSPEAVFNFLIDVKNFEHLMPENTSKFEVLSDTRFLFALKGMPEIVLELKESVPHTKIILGAASDKLPFTLTGLIEELSPEESKVQLVFEGTFNPMMAMMIKNPITKFIDTLVTNMDVIGS